MSDSRRIDTHHHIVPPDYAAWLHEHNARAGGLPIPEWRAEASLDMMDMCGVQAAILSVSTPGVHLGDDGEATPMRCPMCQQTMDGR